MNNSIKKHFILFSLQRIEIGKDLLIEKMSELSKEYTVFLTLFETKKLLKESSFKVKLETKPFQNYTRVVKSNEVTIIY